MMCCYHRNGDGNGNGNADGSVTVNSVSVCEYLHLDYREPKHKQMLHCVLSMSDKWGL
jgi:hypothetical protein